ncbi:MAG: VWA domain-containing protein [Sandaracinaceae bacterium]|nr:VWA domain-containing protein [Sandaracinaceae bacterium]
MHKSSKEIFLACCLLVSGCGGARTAVAGHGTSDTEVAYARSASGGEESTPAYGPPLSEREYASESGDGTYAAATSDAPASSDVAATSIQSSPIMRAEAPRPEYVPPPAGLLTAATVGDADRRDAYLDYLTRHANEASRLSLDMQRRVRFRVVDHAGRPVNDASIVVAGHFRGRTHADGVWDFYPSESAPGLTNQVGVVVNAGQLAVETSIRLGAGDGGDVTVRLEGATARGATALDLAFVIDVTGSMEDELRYVNREIANIVARVHAEAAQTDIRVGAVFYRDRGDDEALSHIQFTHDIGAFMQEMQNVAASGGGDYPEDMNEGLRAGMETLAWRTGNAVRAMVLIADAPPQNYTDVNFRYSDAMKSAAERGIRILPVAASGADRTTEFLMRAMGAFTSTPYTYLTDDSGVGHGHMEADTDRVGVERFNEQLVRMLISDLRGTGMHEVGFLGPQLDQ